MIIGQNFDAAAVDSMIEIDLMTMPRLLAKITHPHASFIICPWHVQLSSSFFLVFNLNFKFKNFHCSVFSLRNKMKDKS